MQAVHGDKCADISTIRRLVREFKQEEVGEASLCDKARSGRPVPVCRKMQLQTVLCYISTDIHIHDVVFITQVSKSIAQYI